MEVKQDGAGSGPWLDFTLWTVALWASLLNLLNFNQYPLFRDEVAIALLGLGAIGVLMGLVQRVARPRLAFLVAGLFGAVMIDLNAPVELTWFYVIWAALAAVAFFALDALLKIFLAASLAVFLFQLAVPALPDSSSPGGENEAQNLQSISSGRAERPAIVHLVVDAHLGLDGMALGPELFRDLAADQVAFFTERGFQFYPGAYSRHTRTTDSLPRMFSYGEDRRVSRWINTHHGVPDELPYFADLDRRGYRTSAVVPIYVDMCVNQKLTHCRSWDSNDLKSMLGTGLGPVDRAKIFLFRLLRLTDAGARVVEAVHTAANDLLVLDGRWIFNRSQLFHLASIRELNGFIEELADLEAGEARFAHVLLPHSPFGLNADCSVKPETAWFNEHDRIAEGVREMAYADQVRCVQRRIGQMLEVLDRSEAGRRAIVLIHGDHGSRIATSHPSLDGPELSPREMLMSHSTLFAIRVPGEPGGTVSGSHALDELMADFRDRDFTSAPRPASAPARVIITDSYSPKGEWRPLPSFDHDLSGS